MPNLSPDDINFLQALDQPSFIKKIPSSYKNNSASWLIEKLLSLVKYQSEFSLDAAFATLNSLWNLYTENHSRDDANLIFGASIENIFSKNLLESFKADDELPSGFSWKLIDGKRAPIVQDFELAITNIKDRFDDLYPTSIDRFLLIKDTTDWRWRNQKPLEDVDIDFDPHFIATVAAINMLGEYIKSIIGKEKATLGFQEIHILNRAHQAHFIAYELLRSSNEISQLSTIYSCLPKRALKSQSASGGKAKSRKTNQIKQAVLNHYNKNSYKSKRQASKALVPIASEFAHKNNLTPLADSNAERTIYGWLLKE